MLCGLVVVSARPLNAQSMAHSAQRIVADAQRLGGSCPRETQQCTVAQHHSQWYSTVLLEGEGDGEGDAPIRDWRRPHDQEICQSKRYTGSNSQKKHHVHVLQFCSLFLTFIAAKNLRVQSCLHVE